MVAFIGVLDRWQHSSDATSSSPVSTTGGSVAAGAGGDESPEVAVDRLAAALRSGNDRLEEMVSNLRTQSRQCGSRDTVASTSSSQLRS